MWLFIESKNNYSFEIYYRGLRRNITRFLTSIRSKSVQVLSRVIKG